MLVPYRLLLLLQLVVLHAPSMQAYGSLKVLDTPSSTGCSASCSSWAPSRLPFCLQAPSDAKLGEENAFFYNDELKVKPDKLLGTWPAMAAL